MPAGVGRHGLDEAPASAPLGLAARLRGYVGARSLGGSLARRGVRGTLRLALLDAGRGARRLFFYAAATGFDRWHDIDTRGIVAQQELGVDAAITAHSEFYLGCHPTQFRRFIPALGIDCSRYTFVDLGSGKGRALLLAREFGFARIIGVELSPLLSAAAAANIARARRFTRSEPTIEATTGNAAEFVFPRAPTVLFLSNPFDATVLAPVLDALAPVAREHPVFVIYQGPRERALVERVPWLTVAATDRNCVIYRSV